MSQQKKDLITKLEEISKLYQKAVDIHEEMDDFEPEDNYVRAITVPKFPGNLSEKERDFWQDEFDHEIDRAVELAEKTHRKVYTPEAPKKPVIKPFSKSFYENTENAKQKMGCFAVGAGLVGVMSLIGLVSSSGDELGSKVSLGLLIISVVIIILTYSKLAVAKAKDASMLAKSKKEYEQDVREQNSQYAAALKDHEKEIAEYEEKLKIFVENYAAWREIYLQSVEEEEQIAGKLEEDRVAAVKKIYEEQYVPAMVELRDCNDLVSEDYLPVLHIITDLIRSNRADDLKEAINLYEDIVYRERQLELEREKEEQRRYEEQLRREDAERHYEEQMEFQKEQERQRKYEAEKQMEMQEQHHKEEMKMQEERIRYEQQAAKDSQKKRCLFCAHKLTCRQRYYDGAYNCTGFTPE